jgi:hypothetical protein
MATMLAASHFGHLRLASRTTGKPVSGLALVLLIMAATFVAGVMWLVRSLTELVAEFFRAARVITSAVASVMLTVVIAVFVIAAVLIH